MLLGHPDVLDFLSLDGLFWSCLKVLTGSPSATTFFIAKYGLPLGDVIGTGGIFIFLFKA